MCPESTGKRVGIIQSNYVPWRGYFDFIASVDLFVIYDDVPYSKNTWRNRNRLKTRSGLKWLTVPVAAHLDDTIDRVVIADHGGDWREKHHGLIRASLGRAPFFSEAIELWERGVSSNDTSLSRLNIRLIKLACEYLGIGTPIVLSREYSPVGTKTKRLIDLLKKLGASTYLTGPSAKDYLDEELFRANGIRVEYKTYDYPDYPQLWGNFVGTVSVLDLIANTGPDASRYLKSRTPDIVAVL